MTPEQLREVLWVVFEKDGNDLFCSTHSQLVKDRHQQLIEEFPDQGPYEVRKYVPYVTHADALEELARVKRAIAESCDEQRGEYFGCRRAERAEAALAEAERKCERLKHHADAACIELQRWAAAADGVGLIGVAAKTLAVIDAYRAEFKG